MDTTPESVTTAVADTRGVTLDKLAVDPAALVSLRHVLPEQPGWRVAVAAFNASL